MTPRRKQKLAYWRKQYQIRDTFLFRTGRTPKRNWRGKLVWSGKSTYPTYEDYIASPEYRERVGHAQGPCELNACQETPQATVIHHKHYETLGAETRDDLLHVCDYCHDCIHA